MSVVHKFFITLTLTSLCLSSTSCSKNKMFFSQKYSPRYNPGGESFYADREFAKNYKIYEKRRELYNKAKNKTTNDFEKEYSLSEEQIIDQLEQYGINQSDGVDNAKSVSKLSKDSMINSEGIDLTLLKGAKFIEIDDSQWGPAIYKKTEKSFLPKFFSFFKGKGNIKQNSHTSDDYTNNNQTDDDYLWTLDDTVDNPGAMENPDTSNKEKIDHKKAIADKTLSNTNKKNKKIKNQVPKIRAKNKNLPADKLSDNNNYTEKKVPHTSEKFRQYELDDKELHSKSENEIK